MRVLDEHKDAFSVWKLDERATQTLCLEENIELSRLRAFQLWAELNIKYSERIDVAHNLATIISGILCKEHEFPANLSRYAAEDVEPILEQVHRAKLGNFRKR